MKRNALLEELRKSITDDIKEDIDFSFEVSDRISEILDKQNKSQRDLADLLNKTEAEVSKWMHGTHNFTIKTIRKIEKALGEKIISVCKQENKEVAQGLTMKVHPQKQFSPIASDITNSNLPKDWINSYLIAANKSSKYNC